MNINKNIELLSKGLNAYSLRNKVISNNIANVETPDYKRQDVKFDEILKKNIENNRTLEGYSTDEKHIRINSRNMNDVNPEVYTEKNTKSRLDGNNVDIDVEMAELSKDHIKFSVVSQQLSGYFRKIKMAITEGRR